MTKLRYIGHAPRVTLVRPVGIAKRTNDPSRRIDLYPGQEFELPQDEADRLLKLDKRKETKKIVEDIAIRNNDGTITDGKVDRIVEVTTDEQTNYELVSEGKKQQETKKDEVKAGKDLKDLLVPDAIELVKATDDAEVLLEWQEEESRTTVLDAIEKKLGALEK